MLLCKKIMVYKEKKNMKGERIPFLGSFSLQFGEKILSSQNHYHFLSNSPFQVTSSNQAHSSTIFFHVFSSPRKLLYFSPQSNTSLTFLVPENVPVELQNYW